MTDSTSASPKPVVLLRPAPQKRDRIFTPEALARLDAAFTVIDLEDAPDDALFEEHLQDAFAIVGQPDLDADRLTRATSLKALINVEGNFFPNVDYGTAFARGVRVLGCGSAYSQAVAEFSLGLALDLARGISGQDGAMRDGSEKYVSESAGDAILLHRAAVGILGYGNLGRSFHRLLQPFHTTVRIYDPWLPPAVIQETGGIPAGLEETLRSSQFLFVFATATADNAHLLDGTALDLLPDGARIILVSRAAVVDYDALLERLQQGRFLAAIDVWPTEPLPKDSPFRGLANTVLSPHRAGGIPQAFHSIGDMVVDDLTLMARGLPPVRLQAAAPELVGRYRNKPVT
ncbi:hydroxyacid dehydrogenase [Arthrobacter burdickii]|uniref:Hydroxyacid dehydrogenase n=1 Tax=Arthrobacter burdickii TaxID=3035920 RepID=A0ABT8JWC0_9MICC|nr:hydroxyacid dehydrogenase [Arthrobacter burdickii]MDN4609475.1 hydroxyacid dehydrogenase [Arthrobacter burdickii]